MSGRHPFSELTDAFTPEQRQLAAKIKAELLAEMPIHQLRQARELTQQELARKLDVKQPAIAKLEHRTDAYISTLRSYIEAVGGRLKIVAEFRDGKVEITNFRGAGEMADDPVDSAELEELHSAKP